MFCLVLKCTADKLFFFFFPDVFVEEAKNERLSGKITRNLEVQNLKKVTKSLFLF